MSTDLKVTLGQYSDKGRKRTNQDFHATYIPREPQLSSKGIAIALADGISSSEVSHIASKAAVTGFLEDYYCTSETWSVKKSVHRVLTATNSWLHAQSQQSQYRYDKDKGYVCTLSAVIIKSATAHVFNTGDTRVYRLRGGELEQVTRDHRLWVSREISYLSRAMGMDPHLELDYLALAVEPGDIFILATDGVYEYASGEFMTRTIDQHGFELDTAARLIVEEAFQRGSVDNLTLQIVRVDELPNKNASEIYQELSELPFPPLLQAGQAFDGYRIIDEIHVSSRSHVYLAEDLTSGERVILKTLSTELRHDPAHLERFLLEEWIGLRIDNPHVLKSHRPRHRRNYLYAVTEYIDGQTLTRWMADNPNPHFETVCAIVQQIANGLRAFHRLEMLHQDLRPDNVMIDDNGQVKIIDFGSALVAGLTEIRTPIEQFHMLGTVQYMAPEYFLGEAATNRSDLFSLGVMTYQMLTGRLPYGAGVARSRTRAEQRKLRYESALADNREIPAWVDEVLARAVHLDPYKRYGELSEFTYDLLHPSQKYLNRQRLSLMERDPLRFWKGIALVLAVLNVFWFILFLSPS